MSRAPVRVVLYTAQGCGLCARAEQTLRDRAATLGYELEVVAIDGDAELERRHRLDLPVIEIDGRVEFTLIVPPSQLERVVRSAQARLAQPGS